MEGWGRGGRKMSGLSSCQPLVIGEGEKESEGRVAEREGKRCRAQAKWVK